MHRSGLDETTATTPEPPAQQPLGNAERAHYLSLCTQLGQPPVPPPLATLQALDHLVIVHAQPVTAAVTATAEAPSSSEDELDFDSDDNAHYFPTDACLALAGGWLRTRSTILRQAARATTPEWRQAVAEHTALTRRDAPQVRALRQRFLTDQQLPRHAAAAATLEAEVFDHLADRARQRAEEYAELAAPAELIMINIVVVILCICTMWPFK